jgi:glycosyltransferase involved in cell wall biosynthesis
VKIAYVLGELGVGGAERQLLRKLELARERGVEIVVVALSIGGQLADAYARRGITVHQLRRHGSRDVARVLRLTQILRRERPHIVHGEQYDAGAYARVAGVLAGVPVRVLAIRSAYPRLRLRYRITETVLKHVTDAYVVNAEEIKRRTIAFHAIPPERVHVQYNVFDPREAPRRTPAEVRAELGLDGNETVLGLVASFSPEKNHVLFLEMARRLADERDDVRFLLVGDGKERRRIEATIERLNLADRVMLLGMRSDVNDLLQVIDVSVNTSIREGLCNALLESLAAGAPVLASRVGGTPELVDDGRHGKLFTSGSVTDMLSATRELLGDLDGYRSRVRADRDRILAPFDETRLTDAAMATYQELLARKGIAADVPVRSNPG